MQLTKNGKPGNSWFPPPARNASPLSFVEDFVVLVGILVVAIYLLKVIYATH
jgi:hypothetical protein